MPEAPARLHLRQVSLEALYGCVVKLLIDLKVVLQNLAKLRREPLAACAGITVVRPTPPRRRDLQALGKKPYRLGHALGDPDDIDLIENARGVFSLGSALVRVAQVDATGCKKKRLHAGAGHSDLLRYLYQRGQRIPVESCRSTANGTVGLHVQMPKRAHELSLRFANNREDAVRRTKSKSVITKDMTGDQIVASNVTLTPFDLLSKCFGSIRRICALITLSKPLIDAGTASFEYMKKNGFFHTACPPSVRLHTNEQSAPAARQAGIGMCTKIQRPRYAAALVVALLTAAPSASLGQVAACDERDSVLEHLASKYGESRIAWGVANGGQLVEVLSSGEDGTWSVIITGRDGISCLIAAGQDWRPVAPSIEPQEEGA